MGKHEFSRVLLEGAYDVINNSKVIIFFLAVLSIRETKIENEFFTFFQKSRKVLLGFRL